MGREFIKLFDRWANTYDQTVAGFDREYEEVFKDYDLILSKVAAASKGNVIEFGVGTGNLMEKLVNKGHFIIGIEPSSEMRNKAKERFPNVEILDGDFLKYPDVSAKINTIVSTYAFHHLNDEEKQLAINNFSKLLSEGDQIVFADTVFEHENAKHLQLEMVEKQGSFNLLHDLKTEYYTTIDVLRGIFEKNGFEVQFERLNDYVWFISATKIK
jgi:putative AdoMet-dependent methyltransferase